MSRPPIYMDYAATTPLDPEVAAVMMEWMQGERCYGNPSSIHYYGRMARMAVDEARDAVAQLIGADYSEITFTGSGTEADNLAVIGAVHGSTPGRSTLVVSAIEHHAVLSAARMLARDGIKLTVVNPDTSGVVLPEKIAEAVTEETALVSVMHANNEIGVIQDIRAMAEAAHRHGALLHSDGVQTAPLLPIAVNTLGCDLFSLSAHKMYGPRGVGALWIRPGVPVSPMIVGGAQEREKRAGTENVAAIAGFGHAAKLTMARRDADSARMALLRDRLLNLLRQAAPDLILNGDSVNRLPNNLNVTVPGINGATLLMNLDMLGVCASSGAACSSGSIEPSHVLQALGLSSVEASGGVRLTLGRLTTEEECDRTAAAFRETISRLKKQ